MASISDILGDAGGAVKDIFGGLGDMAEASAYKDAAKYAAQNAVITAASTRIQESQLARKVFQTVGAQSAQVASAGFASSGSSLDLARNSIAQGSLQKQLVADQGLINENGFKEESAKYTGMASAAKSSGIGGFIGGALKIATMFV